MVVRAGIALFAVTVALQRAAAGAPDTVERVYSRGVYPGVAAALGAVSDAIPFPLAEAVAAAAVALLAVAALRPRRGVRRWPSARAALAAFLAALGWAWFAFLLAWGLNYRRLPLATSAGLDTRGATTAELAALCRALVEHANQLRVGLPEDAHGVMWLADGRAGMLRRAVRGADALRRAHPWLSPAGAGPKAFVASALFSYLGITGLYVPFTAEAQVNVTLPDPELPFVAGHELAHRQGYAREDEANYLGYLACRLHPDGDFRYAGALVASVYALAALSVVDRPSHDPLLELRSAGVGRDLAALAAWSRRYRSTLSEVGSAVNDTYLRAQGQAAGVASYGRMVDLLIAESRIRMRRAPLRVSRHQAHGPAVNPWPRDSGNATLRAPNAPTRGDARESACPSVGS